MKLIKTIPFSFPLTSSPKQSKFTCPLSAQQHILSRFVPDNRKLPVLSEPVVSAV